MHDSLPALRRRPPCRRPVRRRPSIGGPSTLRRRSPRRLPSVGVPPSTARPLPTLGRRRPPRPTPALRRQTVCRRSSIVGPFICRRPARRSAADPLLTARPPAFHSAVSGRATPGRATTRAAGVVVLATIPAATGTVASAARGAGSRAEGEAAAEGGRGVGHGGGKRVVAAATLIEIVRSRDLTFLLRPRRNST